MALILLTLALMGQLRQLRTAAPGLTLLRSVLFGTTSLLVVVALAHMPLADAIALYFVCPVWTVLLAAPLLGERITPSALIAVLLGLAGAWLLINPAGRHLDVWALCALASGFTGALQDIYARRLRGSTTPAGMLFWGLSAMVPLSVVILDTDRARLPQAGEWPLFSLALVAAGLAYYLAGQSFQKAPMRIVAPLRYLNLLWAVLLGWLLWGSVPEPAQAGGIMLIVLAGLICVRLSARTDTDTTAHAQPAHLPGRRPS
jgi:drug/metabolite transporter (DMT)-like permease